GARGKKLVESVSRGECPQRHGGAVGGHQGPARFSEEQDVRRDDLRRILHPVRGVRLAKRFDLLREAGDLSRRKCPWNMDPERRACWRCPPFQLEEISSLQRRETRFVAEGDGEAVRESRDSR